MDKEYVVIGLGRFGGSIVRELNALTWMLWLLIETKIVLTNIVI